MNKAEAIAELIRILGEFLVMFCVVHLVGGIIWLVLEYRNEKQFRKKKREIEEWLKEGKKEGKP